MIAREREIRASERNQSESERESERMKERGQPGDVGIQSLCPARHRAWSAVPSACGRLAPEKERDCAKPEVTYTILQRQDSVSFITFPYKK